MLSSIKAFKSVGIKTIVNPYELSVKVMNTKGNCIASCFLRDKRADNVVFPDLTK